MVELWFVGDSGIPKDIDKENVIKQSSLGDGWFLVNLEWVSEIA